MKIWKCGAFSLEIGAKTLVMGIVNATPDSFSGDGNLGDDALKRALQMVEDGADILDIGGESTRPGAVPVGLSEELSRVLPLIKSSRRALRFRSRLTRPKPKSRAARLKRAPPLSTIFRARLSMKRCWKPWRDLRSG